MNINSQKNINIFFILDISGSMQGERIQSLNNAIRLSIEEARRLSNKNKIKINFAILTFNNECKWITRNILCDVNDIVFKDLYGSNLTYFGQAVDELNSILKRSLFGEGINKQVYIFVSDGYSLDEWRVPIEKIKKNRWFTMGDKFAYILGNDVDIDMINSLFRDKFEMYYRTTRIYDENLNKIEKDFIEIVHLVSKKD